jgi:hypothetical protein
MFECTSERLFGAHMFTERAFRVKHLGTDPMPPTDLTVRPPGEDAPMTATALRHPPTARTFERGSSSPRPVPRPASRVQRTVVVRPAEGAAVSAATYRRRRLTVLAAVTLLAAVLVLLAGRIGHADAELDGPPPAPAVYVVQDGDTLWSIAAKVAPDADRRDVVGQLTDAAGGDALVPGQRIVLPRYFD